MKPVNIEEFLKKDEELRKQTMEMRDAIMEEMRDLLEGHGGKVLFAPVDDISSSSDMVKGFRINDGKVQYLCEWKSKPMIWLEGHNPHGSWYDIQKGYGFKTVRFLVGYLKLLRNVINSK